MEKKNTVEKVRELAEPLCEEQGLFLWDVRFEKEGASWYLKIFIDRDGGVDMDACEEFTRAFNKIIDEADPISQSYVMEIGSPGLGRELRRPEHFLVCVGDEVAVKTIRPVNGQRDFVGILMSYEKGSFVVAQSEVKEDWLTFKTADCSYVKLNDCGDI